MAKRDLDVNISGDQRDLDRAIALAQGRLGKFESDARKANRAISQLEREIASGQKAISKAESDIAKAEKSAQDAHDKRMHAMSEVGGAMVAVGGAVALGVGLVVKRSMEFDKAMSSVGAAANASGGRLEALRRAAIKAGADTQYSATEAAKGEEELAKAGVSTRDILGGGLKGALNLAAAGQIDVADAAETAASAMTQFGLSGKDVPHIADLLSAAANKAQGGVSDMAFALKQSGLVAAQTGLSINETAGALAAFASNGLIGQDAGTSFKQMLISLANPTQKAQGLMDQLGISAYDAQGNFVGIAKFAGVLHDKLAKLTPQQRQSALATIFGSDAIRAANVLYQQGAGGIQNWINKVDDQGNAARTAAAKTDNLSGDLERLKGSLETAAISSGSGLNGVLRGLVKGADAAVDAFNHLPGPVQTGVVALGGIVGVATTAGGALLILVPKVVEAKNAIAALNLQAGLAKASLLRFGQLGVIIAAIGGLEAASSGLEKQLERGRPSADALSRSLGDLGRTQQVTKGFAQEWGSSITRSSEAMRNFDLAMQLWAAGPDVASKMGEITGRLKSLDSSLAQMVTSGNVRGAQAAFNTLAARAQKAGVSMDQFKKMFPQYAKASAAAKQGSDTAAGGVRKVGAQAQTAAGQVNKLTGELNSYYNEVKGDATSASIAFQQSIADLNDKLRQGGTTLKLNTQAGRDNMSAFLAAAQAANDHAQKVYKETGSVQQANKTLRSHVAQLRGVLAAGGLTKKQIDSLIRTYLQLPSKASTKVSAPGATTSRKQVQSLGTAIARIHGKTVAVNANTKGAKTQIGAFYRWFNKIDLTRTATIGFQQLGPGRQGVPFGAKPKADGGIVRFANGGERHVAQIAKPGEMRLWAEPETQGEAYIPLAPSKRGRSTEILAAVAAEFGYALVKEAAGAVRGATPAKKPAARTTTSTTAKPAASADLAGSVAGLASTLPDYTAAAAGTVKGSTQAATGLEQLNLQAQAGTVQFTQLTTQAKTWGTLAAGPTSTQTAALNAHVATLSNTVNRDSATTTANTARRNASRTATVSASAATATHTARVRTDTATLQRANSTLATNASRVRQVGREAVTSGNHVDRFVAEYVKKPWKITRHITVDANGKFTMKGFQGFAEGGHVRGPGGPTDDKVPALLSNDEHVWTSKEVRGAGGHANVERLRAAAAAGALPGFAKGGAVKTRKIGAEGVPSFTPDYTKMLDRVVMAAIKTTAKQSAQIMKSLFGSGAALLALKLAETRLGVPYVWGGTSWSSGMDCSGLTMLSYKKAGVNIPRTSQQQWGAVKHIPIKSALPGDLLFSEFRAGGPGHVGLRTQYPLDSPRASFNEPHTGASASYRGIGGWTAAGRVPGAHAGASSAGGRHAGPAASKAYAMRSLPEFRWGSGQMSPLISLWNGESNWRWNADNPGSSAYGIPQALPGSKMASAGADWHDNSYTQVRWGLGYIKGRYGSPANAYRSWRSRSPHWYDDGGLATGRGLLPKATIHPERVLSPRQTAAFEQLTATLTRISLPRTPVRARGGDGAAIVTAVSDAIRRMPRGDQYTMQLPEGVSAGQMAREITSNERRRRRGGLYV